MKARKRLHYCSRLHAIYKRTFSDCIVHSKKERNSGFSLFDYQCALGSIPQYIYKNLDSFKNRKFEVFANTENSGLLRRKYQDEKNQIVIGISWQGGGRKDRMKDKSIDLSYLLTALKPYKVKILSLQYGDDQKIVKKAASKFDVNFVDDENIQATSNMDAWLDQVNACDGVVSIANTTIHGAGSLKKPTLCLLGAKADWRWLCDKEEKFSYWYPTVEIAWQDEENKNWNPALSKIDTWIQQIINRHDVVQYS